MNFVGFKRSQKLKGNSSNKRQKQLSERLWHKSQKLILPHFNKGRPVIFFKGTAAARCSSRLPSKNKSITSNATRGEHSLKSQGVKPKCNRINHYFLIGKLVTLSIWNGFSYIMNAPTPIVWVHAASERYVNIAKLLDLNFGQFFLLNHCSWNLEESFFAMWPFKSQMG